MLMKDKRMAIVLGILCTLSAFPVSASEKATAGSENSKALAADGKAAIPAAPTLAKGRLPKSLARRRAKARQPNHTVRHRETRLPAAARLAEKHRAALVSPQG